MGRRTITHAMTCLALGLGIAACATGDTSAEGSASQTLGGGGDGGSGSTGVSGTGGGPSTMTSGVDGSESGLPPPGTGTDDGPLECLDADGDGFGDNCDEGPDCDDDDDNVWTDTGCASCADADGDNFWTGCDQYDDDKPGPDCDDTNDSVWTDTGCASCIDADMDMAWVGCDAYDRDTLGPDCDDTNPAVGTEDVVELCDGIAQNCAGEIDPVSADMMCPPMGVTAPNVDVWSCMPPMPGVDGCTIQACDEQYFDLDGQIAGGCECAGTSRAVSLAACGDAVAGYLGAVGEGEQLMGLPVGTIPLIDNGVGAGREDWYRVEFPEADATGTRPQTGSIQVDFAVNDGNDYRFEAFRGCGGPAWGNGLSTAYGAGAPPALEWWFFDNHTPPASMPVPALYNNSVPWPDQVYIRVFRVQNDGTCNDYQLDIKRLSN